MSYVLRLCEDLLYARQRFILDGPRPRALYVAGGSAMIDGGMLPADEGVVLTASVEIEATDEGATLWRWEIDAAGAPASLPAGRGSVRLEGKIEPERVGTALLLRLDSVAFPPGGCALLHTHQGPGIRCLIEGAMRIDTEGHSSTYAPGGPWFESGPAPVFAQSHGTMPSRFIRAMVLPASLLGASSIRYVNEEDKAKPKSQRYRVFAEAPVRLPPQTLRAGEAADG